ncbi:MAG: ImmA/IrrE family metallo-endopeptidase [Chloroflexota bacterium]
MMGRWLGGAAAKALMAADHTGDARGAVIGRARRLLEEIAVEAPPVDLRMVGSFRGVREIQTVRMASAGRLVPEGAGFVIQVNADHSRGRQNFSAAHEIGHVLLPSYQKKPRLIDDLQTGAYDESQEEEYLCDLAAAELLMPMTLFRPVAAEAGFGLEAVTKLAHTFRASREAAAIRLVQTELWPCAVAVWHFAHKPSERPATQQDTLPFLEWAVPQKKLRVRYALAGPNFGHYLYQHLSAHPEGQLVRCYANGTPVFGEEQMEIRGRLVTFQVAAAAVDFPGELGPDRRVISLLLSDKAADVRITEQSAFWSLADDD